MIRRLIIWLAGRKSYERNAHNVFDRLGLLLNIMVFLISGSYFIYDLINEFYTPLIPLAIINAGSLSGFILARNGKSTMGKIVVIVLSNVALFLITCADDYDTGTHLYYITLSIASFTVLGLKHARISYLLTLLSLVFYEVSSLTDYSFLTKFVFTPEEVKARFVLNSSMFIIMSLGIFLLFLRMMNRQQFVIRAKNKLLKSTNAELDHFLYSTSHDLRAPLASVQGLLSIATKTDDPDELRHLHKLMHEQVYKMDDFIKDIINIMRNSRQPLQTEIFNLHDFFEDILTESKFQNGDIRISNEIPQEININTDKVRLKTVAGNLCSNAVKYADKIKTERYVKVNCKTTDGSFVLQISDNGIGIDHCYKDKVFDMFYRATEESKGTGLGLYIAKETMTNLGGEIIVESQLGEGSTFQINLPRQVIIS